MPPKRASDSISQKTKAFKPPRPATKAAATSSKPTPKTGPKTGPNARPKKPTVRPATPSDLLGSEGSDIDDEPRRRSRPAAESPAAVVPGDQPPVIPENLLRVMLQQFYEDSATSIGGEARRLVAKYMETFVREAVARAVVERKGAVDD
ncbi:MAG: hypothetical protein LQ340_008117, partial [Diploschistes diacapsis]